MKDKEQAPTCRFNNVVDCPDKEPRCQKCGWNPKVAHKRKKGAERHGKL